MLTIHDVEFSGGIGFDFDVFPELVESHNAYDFEYQEGGDDEVPHQSEEDRLWWPITLEEPILDPAIDCIADQLEVTRWQQMDVLSLHALCGRGVENKGARTRKKFGIVDHDLLPGNSTSYVSETTSTHLHPIT